MLGLNLKTRMLEAFNPKTYEEALRTVKALEEPPEEKKTRSQQLSQQRNALLRSDPQNSNHLFRDLNIRTGHLLHPQ